MRNARQKTRPVCAHQVGWAQGNRWPAENPREQRIQENVAVIRESEIASDWLAGPRKVWIHPAAAARDCLVFLDGELYTDRVKAPEIVRTATCAYLPNVSAASRHADYTCNESFALFVAELPRWIEQQVASFDRYFLCGLSLSGLAAVFAALRHPGIYAGVLSQSPSAWWNEEWLRDEWRNERLGAPLPRNQRGRFWLSVGTQELQENVTHPPTGLMQKVSQLDAVRRLAQEMAEAGQVVRLAEYDGGHDPACWARELPSALEWLLDEHGPS
jgi:enterochelin esterase-like enzyme